MKSLRQVWAAAQRSLSQSDQKKSSQGAKRYLTEKFFQPGEKKQGMFTLKVPLLSFGLGLKAMGLASLGRKCNRHHAGFNRRTVLNEKNITHSFHA